MSPTFYAHREVRTFAFLYAAARDALEKNKSSNEGQYYGFMSSLVFSAFTIEAYTNHLGSHLISYWEILDRKLTPSEKLQVLFKHLGMEFDTSRRPLQTVQQLLKFRNFMAHGRTEIVSSTGEIPEMVFDQKHAMAKADWEKYCNEQEANRALEDVKAVIDELNTKANHERGSPLTALTTQDSVITS